MLSGLQAAQVGLVRQLEALRDVMAPREYATLVEIVVRWLERERNRRGARL